MKYFKILTLIVWILLFTSSCSTSKEAYDKSVIQYSIKKADVIRELAEFSVAYSIDRNERTFRTDTLADKTIRNKFNRNGLGGLVTITFSNDDYNIISGLIDSTVIFKETTLRSITEIIYDFAANKRNLSDNKTNPQQSVLLNVTDRIYYRRRPFPIM